MNHREESEAAESEAASNVRTALANQNTVRIRALEAELRRSWRSWPPHGPKRVVDCLRFVEGTVRGFQHYSDERMILPHEVVYRELEVHP